MNDGLGSEMSLTGAPLADIDVGGALVRALLREQHPDLADRALERAAEGWDNVLFTLGAGLAVRLPRRAVAAALLEHEQQRLPPLRDRVPLPILARDPLNFLAALRVGDDDPAVARDLASGHEEMTGRVVLREETHVLRHGRVDIRERSGVSELDDEHGGADEPRIAAAIRG